MKASLIKASAGLGLRRALLQELQTCADEAIDFIECAPENWVGVGGRLGNAFAALAARYPLTCHGLSLSLGGVEPLDQKFLQQLRRFLDDHEVRLYSEHLSYSADDGHLYDLMPIPFTEEAVAHVASRIRDVQHLLGRRIAVENVSYYAAPHQAMAEAEFVTAVLQEADCDLLLDVNNIHVNAINHGYDAGEFLSQMPAARIVSYHIAGHYDDADDLKVDTHGANVKPEVWTLLSDAYRLHGVRPTLLERDFNFPPFADLLAEVQQIRKLQQAAPDEADASHEGHEDSARDD
ncbi:MAG: DUF692 domain-containing protein [Luteimonas sp.]